MHRHSAKTAQIGHNFFRCCDHLIHLVREKRGSAKRDSPELLPKMVFRIDFEILSVNMHQFAFVDFCNEKVRGDGIRA